MRTPDAKRLFKNIFSDAVKEPSAVLDEAAFPAYAHRNPLIDRLFWGRLSAVEDYLSARPPGAILDFGCGSGVMSYIMAGFSERVVASDIEPASFRRMESAVRFPGNIAFASAPELDSDRYLQYFDAIVALDVLEHVGDLTSILERFALLLQPGGVVVISGPTENKLYRLGRRIAGERFTGDYHVTNIGRIEEECRRHGRVQNIATLYPILPLFKVFSLHFAKRLNATD